MSELHYRLLQAQASQQAHCVLGASIINLVNVESFLFGDRVRDSEQGVDVEASGGLYFELVCEVHGLIQQSLVVGARRETDGVVNDL